MYLCSVFSLLFCSLLLLFYFCFSIGFTIVMTSLTFIYTTNNDFYTQHIHTYYVLLLEKLSRPSEYESSIKNTLVCSLFRKILSENFLKTLALDGLNTFFIFAIFVCLLHLVFLPATFKIIDIMCSFRFLFLDKKDKDNAK